MKVFHPFSRSHTARVLTWCELSALKLRLYMLWGSKDNNKTFSGSISQLCRSPIKGRIVKQHTRVSSTPSPQVQVNETSAKLYTPKTCHVGVLTAIHTGPTSRYSCNTQTTPEVAWLRSLKIPMTCSKPIITRGQPHDALNSTTPNLSSAIRVPRDAL